MLIYISVKCSVHKTLDLKWLLMVYFENDIIIGIINTVLVFIYYTIVAAVGAFSFI